jgi:hypothetical protein
MPTIGYSFVNDIGVLTLLCLFACGTWTTKVIGADAIPSLLVRERAGGLLSQAAETCCLIWMARLPIPRMR